MDDLISRQAAIDSLTLNAGWKDEEGRSVEDWDERKKIWTVLISLIPSAHPKRGYWAESPEHIYMGNEAKEWINWYCSECDAPNDRPTDFCPHCGADMRGKPRLHITEIEEGKHDRGR